MSTTSPPPAPATVNGLGNLVRALVIAQGAQPEEVEPVVRRLAKTPRAGTPEGLLDQVRAEVLAVRSQ